MAAIPSDKIRTEKPLKIPLTNLQLFNPLHKLDLFKLFDGVRLFQTNDLLGTPGFEDSDLENDFPPELEISIPDLPKDEEKEMDSSVGKGLSCTTCEVTFVDVTEQRMHYKLDWHRYNLKMKLHSLKVVDEAQFGEMMDDLSSIEGSDEEDSESAPLEKLMSKVDIEEEEEITNSKFNVITKYDKSKLYFENSKNDIFCFYKAIFPNADSKDKLGNNDNQWNNLVTTPPKWIVIMVSGGHFAAAVFEGGKTVLHKTFHSYTVRAKQGGSQSARDAKGGGSHPKSAGASLRRYNEAAFATHIEELMKSWKAHLEQSELIFYRAVSSSANVLFGGKNPLLQRSNSKLRTIPFQTKRPTLSEVKRVHLVLSSTAVYEKERFVAEYINIVRNTPKRKIKPVINRAKSRSPARRDEPIIAQTFSESENENDECCDVVTVEESIDFTNLQEFDCSLTSAEIKRKRRPRPKKEKPPEFPKPIGLIGKIYEAVLQKDDDTACSLIVQINKATDHNEDGKYDINEVVDENQHTVLHLAAQKNMCSTVNELLAAGCDPCLKAKSGKYPYNYAESKECRNTFRRYRGLYPDQYDYQKSQIPEALTDDLEKAQMEKKKQINKLKQEKFKQKKQEKKHQDKETTEKERYLNLSDREKRALAAEKRILVQSKRMGEKAPILVRCFECATDITGKVPFEYCGNLFCSSKCLSQHRKKFPTPLSV